MLFLLSLIKEFNQTQNKAYFEAHPDTQCIELSRKQPVFEVFYLLENTS